MPRRAIVRSASSPSALEAKPGEQVRCFGDYELLVAIARAAGWAWCGRLAQRSELPACASAEGTTTFHVNPGFSPMSSALGNRVEKQKTVPIEARLVKLSDSNHEDVDLLKPDIEGGEGRSSRNWWRAASWRASTAWPSSITTATARPR